MKLTLLSAWLESGNMHDDLEMRVGLPTLLPGLVLSTPAVGITKAGEQVSK